MAWIERKLEKSFEEPEWQSYMNTPIFGLARVVHLSVFVSCDILAKSSLGMKTFIYGSLVDLKYLV